MPSDPAPPPIPDDVVTIDPGHLAATQAALLTWFAAHGRDLPWRHTRDPWPILVSEVMLQQIQVARAVPFYDAFLARFPIVHDLAAAPLADAIIVWGDLGRYRRVVNLHRAARLIATEHGGLIPADVAALRRLPGIGPYTAAAVACLAFGQDLACIDTNVRRVLHRLLTGVDVPRPIAGEAALARLAAAAVPPGRGWDWNQGLMDLGATVCAARRPACARYPVQSHCRAHPAILDALAQAGRPGPGQWPVDRYQDSNRYHHGRVLARLRAHALGERAAEGLSLAELGAQLRPGFAEVDLPWRRGVVASLARDGLAVTEERPAYDASSGAAAAPPEVRVRLPDR
jgi:A/G-specific adenine glycosylase